MFVIVVHNQYHLTSEEHHRVIGPYEDYAGAERDRRDMHMDHVLAGTYRPPLSYVIEMEQLSSG